MTDVIEQSEERRRERRLPVAGRVKWCNVNCENAYWAWLSDASPSSIAFIMSTDTLALMDDEIVLTGPNAPHGTLRITRIAPYDDALSLVAAQRLGANC